jgi:hypothetical protein
LLIKQLWNMGIRDRQALACISKMLKAEIDGEGVPFKGVPQGGLCKALHKPPYAKKSTMQSKPQKARSYQVFGSFTLHSISATALKAKKAAPDLGSSPAIGDLPGQDRLAQSLFASFPCRFWHRPLLSSNPHDQGSLECR